jgi:post-segregation antitoxin (ccd killing protein)
VFDAFGLQIVYDKLNRRIEISATITEAIAGALENAKAHSWLVQSKS